MSATAQKNATYNDLLALPEHTIGEIINGELYSQPRPAPKHARAYSVLGGKIGGSFDWGGSSPADWWIIDEPELHIDSHVLVPDLAGWKRERMPELPETAWFEVIPDWICEILSPSTARKDRMIKMPLYAALGVAYFWLIDPELQTLEVYQLDNQRWTLMASLKDDDVVSEVPFDALTFSLSELWG